ncbi:MAG: Rpn family recombination-promoting nuclease/putative transposase, partial [Coriobacteriales bacterium]|nr:Rpn family recombination-promoting nuclease/putative transposase [Coriobacteriales bacterium]
MGTVGAEGAVGGGEGAGRPLRAKSDVVFRILFGSDGSEEILAGLLSSVLDLPEEEYESLAIV